jgi:hypothetical protein
LQGSTNDSLAYLVAHILGVAPLKKGKVATLRLGAFGHVGPDENGTILLEGGDYAALPTA